MDPPDETAAAEMSEGATDETVEAVSTVAASRGS